MGTCRSVWGHERCSATDQRESVTLREVNGLPPTCWERPLAGSLDRLMVRSEALEDNPLRDSAVRPLFVYQPPTPSGRPLRLPSIYLLQGFGGQLEEWLAPGPSGETTIEELDAMFDAGAWSPALIVFVDASTRGAARSF
jgi:hypothetical protein